MKIQVVVFDGVDVAEVGHADVELLGKFAPACVFGRLSAFHLAAGEFPEARHLSVAAPNGEHAVAVAVFVDDSRCHTDCFHATYSQLDFGSHRIVRILGGPRRFTMTVVGAESRRERTAATASAESRRGCRGV